MAQLKLAEQDRKELVNRLKRAEGQMGGVQRMIEEERDCEAILQQLTAVRSALHTASLALARAYATQCLIEADDAAAMTQMIDSLMYALGKLPDNVVQPGGNGPLPSQSE
jgi:DNA-binding FrmR family transcriptional regulator